MSSHLTVRFPKQVVSRLICLQNQHLKHGKSDIDVEINNQYTAEYLPNPINPLINSSFENSHCVSALNFQAIINTSWNKKTKHSGFSA